MTTWRTTWILSGTAVALFVFIYFFERRLTPSGAAPPPPAAIIAIKSADVTAIQLRRTNQFVLRAERTNQGWNISAPINYPGQAYAVEHLLNTLTALLPYTYISPEELKTLKKTVAEFGLDAPMASLTLHHSGRRTEILFGARTPGGDQVYCQLPGQADTGIYVVPAEVIRYLPRTANDWRDPSFINLENLNADRFEVRNQGRIFAVQGTTNQQFFLTKPSPARADRAKVEALLRRLQEERVLAFVADDPRAELDKFGLQPPETEVVFGFGTNELLKVEFGKSPSNDVVYARRLANNNVVLVSRAALEAVQVSAQDLRDRHLLAFNPANIDTVEIAATEKFVLRRQSSNTWAVTEPQPMLADSELVRECLGWLSTMEGNVEKDAVIEFGTYGLAQPLRQYLLKVTTTNGASGLTNRLVTELDVGGQRDDGMIFARGPENAVFAVDSEFINRLPTAMWQLRDRRVWSFTTNQIARLTIRHGGNTRQLSRGTAGDWRFEAGSVGVINPYSIEETMFRLGELRATVWVDRGEGKRQLYGFRDNGDKLIIELKGGDKPQVLSIEFGDKAKSGYPYALATIDGQSWIFEFPLQLYIQIRQRLFEPIAPRSTG